MKKYYPDWHKWFTNHPEDIGNYFSPPPPFVALAGVAVSVKIPEITEATTILSFSGKVRRLDEAARTIEVSRKRKSMTLALDDQTKITQAESGMVLRDIEEGMYVFIEYKEEDDKMIATAIKVAPPGAAMEEKPAKPAKGIVETLTIINDFCHFRIISWLTVTPRPSPGRKFADFVAIKIKK